MWHLNSFYVHVCTYTFIRYIGAQTLRRDEEKGYLKRKREREREQREKEKEKESKQRDKEGGGTGK